MAGTRGTNKGISKFDESFKSVLYKTSGYITDTALLSKNTINADGNTDDYVRQGYVLVKVANSGTGAQSHDVGKWREFDSAKADLDDVDEIAILANTVDLSEEEGDVPVTVILHGICDKDIVNYNGTLDFDNNSDLSVK